MKSYIKLLTMLACIVSYQPVTHAYADAYYNHCVEKLVIKMAPLMLYNWTSVYQQSDRNVAQAALDLARITRDLSMAQRVEFIVRKIQDIVEKHDVDSLRKEFNLSDEEAASLLHGLTELEAGMAAAYARAQ